MRDILELCVDMDTFAERTYARMAEACTDPQVRDVFTIMGKDEAVHVSWWAELLEAWEQGLVPDIINDTTNLVGHLQSTFDDIQAAVPEDLSDHSTKQLLELATRVEFYLLDPIFGELIDLTEPGRARERHESYGRHVDHLVEAIKDHYEADSLAAFLAGILSRTWRDNLKLATYATRDPLTGLHNRRALDAHLAQWASWSARYGRPLTVLLVDVDYFKGINDDFGHATGDQVLQAVGEALSRVTRRSDLVVRYGGDEFAIVAPESEPEEYRHIVQRILDTIHRLELTDGHGAHVPVTVSVGGVVAVDPAGSLPRNPDRLLASADQALYSAKQAGRDRASDPILLGAPIGEEG